MSHFDAQAVKERQELVQRLVEDRAAFVRELQKVAVADRAAGPKPGATSRPHQLPLDSKAHLSVLNPLRFFLRLGCEGQKAIRKVLSREKGGS